MRARGPGGRVRRLKSPSQSSILLGLDLMLGDYSYSLFYTVRSFQKFLRFTMSALTELCITTTSADQASIESCISMRTLLWIPH